MKKKICIVTGSRAEYGLLRPLIKEIRKDKAFKLYIIVTGAHLSRALGLTCKEIEQDRVKIYKKVDIGLDSDDITGISRSIGLAMNGFARTLNILKPDIVVVLGDRFEIFGVVVAALISKIPVAHIGGGELTEGSLDNYFRHAITKMSQIHFVCTEEYRKRVIQMGENPKYVFNAGSLGLDNIRSGKLLSKKELEAKFNFRFGNKNLLVTFHPATLEKASPEEQFRELLRALDSTDAKIFFTLANADTGGRAINRMIDDYVKSNTGKAFVFASMGSLNYLSMMKFVDGVVGNSSSGIAEAPSFKIGTVNIGNRQKGRIRSKSVIDCKPIRHDIKKAIRKLCSPSFKKQLKKAINPYEGKSRASKAIKNILKRYAQKPLLEKYFYDLDFKIRG